MNPSRSCSDAPVDLTAVDGLPLPGGGRTWDRWRALAAIGARDLVEARLIEGHVDAVAILAELAPGVSVPTGLLGVWAAEAPFAGVHAEPGAGGWCITGSRQWCSGAGVVTAAVLTAHAHDGLRAFLVDAPGGGWAAVEGTWPAVGMSASDSREVRFDAIEVSPHSALGSPRAYLTRPGFWHGALGVAACWFGGAVGVGRVLRAKVDGAPDPHRLAHLGAVDAILAGMAIELQSAAETVDLDPHDRTGGAEMLARRTRASVERGCEEVLARAGRATGAGPLCLDGTHSRRVADLTAYLRQSHGDADLARLGEIALQRDGDWLDLGLPRDP